MLIILEGPDGVGKTTLARELLSHPDFDGARIVHAGPPTRRSLLEEYLLPLVHPGEPRIILDRWHLGELVYPNLGRSARESLVTDIELAYLEMFLLSRGAFLVHVDVDGEMLYERRAARGESDVDLGDIKLERDLFTDAVHHSHLDRLYISGRSLGSADLGDRIEFIARLALEVRRRVASLTRFPTYVGPPRPRVLLLGDERGPTDRRYPTAFVPLPATSGHYLMRSLPGEWLRRLTAGFANANEDDAHALWLALGQPAVVALGHRAFVGAFDSGLRSFGAVPHPQFVRRFHFGLHEDYGMLIRQVYETREDLRKWPR